MPAKGGNTDLDDVEVQRAVVYMANAGGAKFPEPAAAGAGRRSGRRGSASRADRPHPTRAVAAIAAINAGSRRHPRPARRRCGRVAARVADTDAGKKLYASVCTACHGAGIAGAPKFGDKAAWAPRIAEGLDTLYQHAINGYQGKNGVMPPKGGSSASDDDVKAAVRYITAAAK